MRYMSYMCYMMYFGQKYSGIFCYMLLHVCYMIGKRKGNKISHHGKTMFTLWDVFHSFVCRNSAGQFKFFPPAIYLTFFFLTLLPSRFITLTACHWMGSGLVVKIGTSVVIWRFFAYVFIGAGNMTWKPSGRLSNVPHSIFPPSILCPICSR